MSKICYFNMPTDWDIKECFSHIEGNFIILDKPIDHGIFERCECQIFDFSCQGCKHESTPYSHYNCLFCKRRYTDYYENM